MGKTIILNKDRNVRLIPYIVGGRMLYVSVEESKSGLGE